jgi:hypothetical protein
MLSSFSKTIQAAVWMTGSIVSFSAMAVSGREISYELDTFEIMLYPIDNRLSNCIITCKSI